MAASIFGSSTNADGGTTYWRIRQDGPNFTLEHRCSEHLEWSFEGRSSLDALVDVAKGCGVQWTAISDGK